MDEDVVERVHRAFADARLEYALVGRTAARLWGAPAAERGEVEVLARVLPGEADRLLAAAKAVGFEADAGLAGLALEGGDHLTLFPGGEAFVDVKPARGAADLATLRTRVALPLGDTDVMAAPVEDTVARLLDEGGEDNLEAARALLERHAGRLDEGFLGQRCEELRVAWLLREVRGEAPPAV